MFRRKELCGGRRYYWCCAIQLARLCQRTRESDAQLAQLRLLEIGVDADLVERANRHQALADLNIVARIDISARDGAVDLRDAVAMAKVELGQSEIALGGLGLGLGLLDRRRLRSQPREWRWMSPCGSNFSNSSSSCFGVCR